MSAPPAAVEEANKPQPVTVLASTQKAAAAPAYTIDHAIRRSAHKLRTWCCVCSGYAASVAAAEAQALTSEGVLSTGLKEQNCGALFA